MLVPRFLLAANRQNCMSWTRLLRGYQSKKETCTRLLHQLYKSDHGMGDGHSIRLIPLNFACFVDRHFPCIDLHFRLLNSQSDLLR